MITLITLVSVFPLYYTIVMASHTNAEMAAATPPLLPDHLALRQHAARRFELAPLNQGLVNSLIVSGAVTLGTVAFCTLAGFAFAKLRFRGSNLLLAICIATMMVPLQMGVIPLYMLMARLGLAGHLPAVILPSLCTAFGVFFMRQYISSAVPDELIEAGLDRRRQPVPGVLVRGRAGRAAGDGGARDAHVPDGLERLLLADHRAQLAEPHGPGARSRAWPPATRRSSRSSWPARSTAPCRC